MYDSPLRHYTTLRGSVVCDATGRPVKRAFVVARWRSTWRAGPGADEVHYHYEASTHDINGRFAIGLPPLRFLLWRSEREVRVFRNGMVHAEVVAKRGGRLQARMQHFAGSHEDVMEHCRQTRAWCGWPAKGNVALAPLYRQLLKTASAIAATEEQREVVALLAGDLWALVTGSGGGNSGRAVALAS